MTTPGILSLLNDSSHLMYCTIVWQEWRETKSLTKEQIDKLKEIGETKFLDYLQGK